MYVDRISIGTVENHVTSKQQQWRKPLKNTVDSGRTFFDISVKISQICMCVEADTPEKVQQHAHCMRLSDKDLVNKLLQSNRIFRSLINNFFTRSLFETR